MSGRRSTIWEMRTPPIALRTAYSQPKRIWLETTKTNASETTRSFSTSSGTGFMSARSASPKNRMTPTQVERSGRLEGDPHHRPGRHG